MTSLWICGSATIPFLPTLSLPASNCGLIKATASPFAAKTVFKTGQISFKEIKDTSIQAKRTCPSVKSSGLLWRKFVFSITVTRSSFLNFQSNWFVPTSKA